MSEAAPTLTEIYVPPQRIPVVSQVSPTVALYERAIRDPSIDLDRLERIANRLDAERAEERERAFNQAINAAQQEMKVIGKDAANSQTHSRYATYAKLDKAIRPIYTKHGFGVSFDTDLSPKGENYLRVLAYITHGGGHTRIHRYDVPVVTKGPKGNDVMTLTHATQSAYTYGKRAILGGVFNIAVGEQDDDGNAAGGITETNSQPINADQENEINDLLKKARVEPLLLAQFYGVESVKDIPSHKFNSVVNKLNKTIEVRSAAPAEEKAVP